MTPAKVDEQPVVETVRGDVKEHGLYTIMSRAIPDIRDGLKPVQRLVLWALWVLKKTSKAIPAKCAKVAGDTTGNYHPHGDAPAYDALVNLHWQHYPLVIGQGNFGNPNKLLPQGHAAPRYTETKLEEISERFFDDIHVADMEYNYTGELEQPLVLPSRIPTLLINGAQGIATAMTTKLPPHNLREVLNAAEALLEDPDLEVSDLLRYVKGPDAGVGVLLSKKKDYLPLYETGKGKVQYSCTYEIEDGLRGSQKLVITGKAPGFSGQRFLKETVALKERKLIVAPAND
jgi:DNA gyrase/topoisomerase IV subunit A